MAAINLNVVWEWNVITGDPFIPPVESPNSRYSPTVAEMGEIVYGTIAA